MNLILIFSAASDDTLLDIAADAGFSALREDEVVALAAHAQRETPIAILVDLVNDPAAGHDALEALQNYPATAASPHIALTPAQSEARQQAIQHGATEILTAPLDAIELRTRLRTMIRLNRARDEAQAAANDSRITENKLMGIVDILEHDLRSPVSIAFSSLDLMSEILRDDYDTPEAVFHLLDNTVMAMRRQLFLIEDTVDWIRLEANQLETVRSAINVAQEIELGMQNGQELADANGVLLAVDIPADLPAPMGNPVLFRRAVNAVLDTALKFMLKGQELKITARQAENGVEITFTDPGRPIKEHYGNNRLFDLDLQSEARNVGSRSSVALGLPFARAAIRSMSGQIDIETAEDSNLTTLRIWLPL